MIPVATGQLSLHHLQYSLGMSIHQLGYFEDDSWRRSTLQNPKLSSWISWYFFFEKQGKHNDVVPQILANKPQLEKIKLDGRGCSSQRAASNRLEYLKFRFDNTMILSMNALVALDFLRHYTGFPTSGCSNAHVANLETRC